MASLVLDVSVAAAWILPDEDKAYARRVLTFLEKGRAVVPALFWYEIENVLLISERRGRIMSGEAVSALTDLRFLNPLTHGPDGANSALHLARTYDLTAYDAAYLALAISHDLPLATLDRKLSAAAAECGVLFRQTAQ